jgi:hypothetical protein
MHSILRLCQFVFCFAAIRFLRFLFCSNSFSVAADLFFMVSEQAADPASVQLAELQNVFQQAL